MMDPEFFRDMVEILSPFSETETGASGEGDYGVYYQFPTEREVEDGQIEELLGYFGIEIPFGEKYDINEVLDDGIETICNGLDPEEIEKFCNFGEENVVFYKFKEVRAELIELLASKGAPIGAVLREDEGDVPPGFGNFN